MAASEKMPLSLWILLLFLSELHNSIKTESLQINCQMVIVIAVDSTFLCFWTICAIEQLLVINPHMLVDLLV